MAKAKAAAAGEGVGDACAGIAITTAAAWEQAEVGEEGRGRGAETDPRWSLVAALFSPVESLRKPIAGF